MTELVLLGADTSPGLERAPARATWAEAFDDMILFGTGTWALGDSTLKLVQKSQPVGEGLPERTVRCRVDLVDIKQRWGVYPDAAYDPSRDKPDLPVVDVWGEPVASSGPKPAWPSKQRVGLYLPE